MADNKHIDPKNIDKLFLQYAKNDLSNADKHLLEKQSLDDPFLADALEGIEQVENKAILNSTLQNLHTKVNALTNTPAVSTTTAATNFTIVKNALAIAASLAVLVVGAYFIATQLQSSGSLEKELASKQANPQLQPLPPSTGQNNADSNLAMPDVNIGALSYNSVTDSVTPYTFSWNNLVKPAQTQPNNSQLFAGNIQNNFDVPHGNSSVIGVEDNSYSEAEGVVEPAPPVMSEKTLYNTYGPASNNSYSNNTIDLAANTKATTPKKPSGNASHGERKDLERTSGTEVTSGTVTADGSIALYDFKQEAATKPTPNSNPYNSALTEYNNGNYKAAIKGFEEVIKSEPNNTKALYYLASAYNNTGKSSKAIEFYNRIPKSNNLYESALYEKAKILVAQKNTTQAKLVLIEVVNLNGVYKFKAQTMLDKLGK